ncbi:MAG: protein kinase [bacterium]|nr:protein kinase [bacterium]
MDNFNTDDINKNNIHKTDIDKTDVDKTYIELTQVNSDYNNSYDNLLSEQKLIDNTLIKLTYFLEQYKIKMEMDFKGAEADYYLISDKNNNQYFLKLYRKGFKPKFEILKRVQELYQEFPQYFINIISYGYDKNTQRYYEIQEYMKHGNLLEFYKNKDITIEELKTIVKHINEALNVLHKKNIIHRDIKPQNILVRKDNPIELLLTDFGISSLNEEDVSKIITTHFKETIDKHRKHFQTILEKK